MEFGVFFPQLEIGADPVVTRDFVQAVEGLGYSHLMVGDHPLGVDPTSHPGLGQRYSLEDSFPEPLVLLGYIAAVTKQIDLVTSVVILPQRQTALVAKQAAQVDVLSGGRLRLGVGVGWNKVEYEALGQDFHSRGRRQEEQIALLRSLWTQPVVTFQGTWDRVTGVGLNPLPVQRPIPIWLGGEADVVLRRIARLADGWIRNSLPDEATGLLIQRLRDYAREAGRNPAEIGIEGRIGLADGRSAEALAHAARSWRDLGATHLYLSTMGAGLSSPAEHIDAIQQAKAALEL